jgi:6,7-dimethyl-8-ribityllumazine synthase
MPPELRPSLDGNGLRVGLIASQFNEFVTARLLSGALDALQRAGVREKDTLVAWVPGALELPQAARRMADSRQWDALVTLGAVIRGETSHYDHVATEAARGVAEVARETGVPVSFGVLTAENAEQAADRAGGKLGNRGADAADAAVKMANLFRALREGQGVSA